MKKSLSCLIWAIVPTISIFSYPIFHGIQSAMGSVEGLDAAGMILAAIATVLSAFSVAYVSAKENLPKWLPPAHLGYCLVAIVLALRFMGWSAPYHIAELYLTAIVFVLCLVCAYIGALVGRSMRAWEDKRAA